LDEYFDCSVVWSELVIFLAKLSSVPCDSIQNSMETIDLSPSGNV